MHRTERVDFIFDTHELGRRPGAMREITRTVTLAEAMGNDLIAVAQGADLTIEVRLESVLDGVLATGQAHGVATGECGRCLEPLELPVDVDFQQLYLYSGKGTEDDVDSDDVSELDGELLDTSAPITDAVVLALPFQPLCDDDCPGLCSECGARFADQPDHTHDDLDPRWSSLTQLIADGDR